MLALSSEVVFCGGTGIRLSPLASPPYSIKIPTVNPIIQLRRVRPAMTAIDIPVGVAVERRRQAGEEIGIANIAIVGQFRGAEDLRLHQ